MSLRCDPQRAGASNVLSSPLDGDELAGVVGCVIGFQQRTNSTLLHLHKQTQVLQSTHVTNLQLPSHVNNQFLYSERSNSC